jgi:hypothetical protein
MLDGPRSLQVSGKQVLLIIRCESDKSRDILDDDDGGISIDVKGSYSVQFEDFSGKVIWSLNA